VNYKKIHDSIIERAQKRLLDGYYEKHHIIPRCMGGLNDPDNLVNLTPEEHYIVHQLLVKMYPNNYTLIKAAAMMVPNRPNNKMYGWIKRRFSKIQKEAQSGKKNSQYNTVWVTNGKDNKKVAVKSQLEDGWWKGRTVVPNIRKQVGMCRECKKVVDHKNTVAKRIKSKHYRIRRSESYQKAVARKQYQMFRQSNLSLGAFSKKIGVNKMTLSIRFRRFIPEYNNESKMRVKLNKG